MALQDDINNLTRDIAGEEQSATILDDQISSEQLTSGQKVQAWQQQAGRHRDAAVRMSQDLQAKQQELAREQQQAQAEAEGDAKRRAAEEVARRII